MTLGEIERATLQDCQPYEQTLATQWLVLTRYVSALITLALFVFGFRNRELYLTLFGLTLTLDSLVNVVLQSLIQDPVPIPGCGGPWGMPSFQVQHSSCFITFILTYGFIWPNRRHGYSWYAAGLVAWLAVVAYAHLYFNYNSPAQIIVASWTGALVGWLGQMTILRWIWPRFPAILGWSLVKWHGYSDTFCSYCVSDIVVSSPQSPQHRAPPPTEPPLF